MVILIKSPDSIGLVSAISGVMARERANIITMREYVDIEEQLFFARLHIQTESSIENLKQQLEDVLPERAVITVSNAPVKKVVLLVTKEHHCLSDLLIRHHFKSMKAEVQAVIGNHEVLREVSEKFDVPFHYIATEGKTKAVFENELCRQIDAYRFDYIVLAKFMRILSADFVEKYPLKIINIHHSFLPAFIGASPYKQAYERGVKIIGATAHYVTNDLDEGPIISQQITPVNHNFTVSDMIKAGREVEKSVLATALQLVFEDRVFVYNNKTVVFD
ncbi:formyltetrahydrofolate deformylase [Polluticaenibacter yanchengensis]|uniref:Formyltetrahydrofolate deformylase n=1 Tax=Polluticaenibacter yanchengensis TaxID=3014562 RepID=A0ABT4UNR3_9BACT|nr:formyltetrahydrofolate deformylase [Chitinophagaceae bacterium LY-5]